MASTYSQYKIELVGTGEQAGTWGTTTNNNFGSATPGTYQGFEQAIGGRADVTMSGTTTLSLTNSNAAQDARALYLNLSGTLSGAADLVVPALQKSYLVKNGTTGGFAVTIKVIGQTGVSIPNGKTVWVYNNGTDIVTAVDFIPEIATTTVDATNIEVTNIKAKDGTSAGSIADSTGVVTLASSVLTTTDINGGTIDGTAIGGSTADAGSFTTLNTSGAVVFNDAGADVDFRVESDTVENALFVDGATGNIGIGTGTPTSNRRLDAVISADASAGIRVVNSNAGTATSSNTSYNNGTSSHEFGILGTNYSTYGVLAASDAYIYASNNQNIAFGADGVNSIIKFGTGAGITERMRIDSSGNVGIGVTPSAWDTYKAIQISSQGSLSSTSTAFNMGTNAYYGSGGYTYIANGEATLYQQNVGGHNWRTAASGTAGNAISFTQAMTLDTSGNLGIGTTSPAQRLHIIGLSAVSARARVENASGYLMDVYAGVSDGVGLVTGNNMMFFEVNSAERMRIDTSGNVGIGTTTAAAGGLLTLNRAPAAAFGTPMLQVGGGSFTSGGYYSVGLGYTDATYTEPPAEIAFVITTDTGGTKGSIVFGTRSVTTNTAVTERARITSGGYFKASDTGSYADSTSTTHEFNNSVNAATLRATSTSATYNGVTILSSASRNTTNNSYYHLGCYKTGSGVLFVADSGDVTNINNSYGAISDVKLKQDIVDAASQWDDIKNLRVRKFHWKSDPGGFLQMGLVAQEAELVSPGLIDEHPDYEEVEVPVLDDEGNPVLNEDGTPQVTKERNALGTTTKAIKYSVLYMKAVKALQEAIERIETLEAKVAALEAK
jgi:hypothetical protein